MTLEEVRAVLIPVALAMRAEFDGPTQRAYQRLLKDVPAALVVAGLENLLDESPRFFPGAPELQQWAERARRQQLAALPYDGCAECEGQRGWRTLIGADGQKTVSVCPCKARHRAMLASRGLVDPLASLPGEAPHEGEAVYPTLEQLPERIQARLQSIAAQKVLR